MKNVHLNHTHPPHGLITRVSLWMLCTLLMVLIQHPSALGQTVYTKGADGIQSPTAASIARANDADVSLYTGGVNYAIPIHTIAGYPVTLSYSHNGLKPAEIPGITGLGWNVTGIGLITRTVRSLRDEESGGYKTISDSLQANAETASSEFIGELQSGLKDALPDIFHYNFAGFSGTFVYDKYGNIRTDDDTPLDVGITITSGEITEIVIRDPSGNNYFFGTNGVIERTKTHTRNNAGSPLLRQYNSSWYLTRIDYTSGKTLNFEYTVDEISDLEESPSDWTERRETGESFSPPTGSDIYNYTSVKDLFKKRPYLSKIVYQAEELVFSYDSNRLDYATEKKLSSVEIKRNSSTIKKYNLSFMYLGSNDYLMLNGIAITDAGTDTLEAWAFEYYDTIADLPGNTTHQTDHWGFYNGESTNDNPQQLLSQYYVKHPSYPKYTLHNGLNRNPDHSKSKTSLLKRIGLPTGGELSFEYEPNTYSKIGGVTTVKDIQHVEYTGGILNTSSDTVFYSDTFSVDIETNEELPFDVYLDIIIEQDPPPAFSCNTADVNIASGVHIYLEGVGHSYTQELKVDPNPNDVCLMDGTNLPGPGDYRIKTVVPPGYADSLNSLFTVRLNAIVGKVPYNITGPGHRIKTVTSHDGISAQTDKVVTYKYDQFTDTLYSSGALSRPNQYWDKYLVTGTADIIEYRFLDNLLGVSSNGPVMGYSNVAVVENSGNNSFYTNYYFTNSGNTAYNDEVNSAFLPAASWTSRGYARGKLLWKIVYNASGEILTWEVTEHEFMTKSNIGNYGSALLTSNNDVPEFTIRDVGPYTGQLGTTEYVNSIAHRTPVWNRVASTEYYIHNTNEIDAVTTKTFYTYNETNKQVRRDSTLNSNGDDRVTVTRFAYQEEPAIADSNMLTQPYSVSVEDGSENVLSKNWTEWSKTLGNADWMPWKQWQWEGLNATDTSAPTAPTTEAVMVQEITSYDAYGNPLEVQDAAGTKTAYEWSTDGTTPVGVFRNAPKNQVFAHSFAYDGLEGWTTIDTDGSDFDVSIDQGKLKLTNYASASNEELDRVYYDYGSEITGTVVVEFDVQMANSNNWDLIIAAGGNTWSYGNGGTETAVWSAINNESWRYYTGSWNSIASGLEIGKTHVFKMVLNTTLNRVDFYIDGKKWVSSASFGQSSSGIQKIAFGSYGYGTTTTNWYIDNVRMYPEGAEAISQETDPVFGTPLAIKDVSGSTSRFTYDNFGRLKETFNPNGERVSRNAYYYSLDNNVAFSATDPNRVEVIAYNNPADTTDKTLSVSYLDGLGRPIQSQSRAADGTAVVTGTLYDERGLPHITSRPVQLNVNSYTNGFVNDLWGTGFGGGPGEALPTNSEIYQYYDSGFGTLIDAQHAYTQTQFEDSPLARPVAEGNAASALRIGQNESLMSYGLNSGTEDFSGFTDNQLAKTVSTDPNGNHTFAFTDGWGNTIASLVDMNGDSAKSSTDLVTEFQYDLRNQLKQVKDPKGLTTSYTYNQRGQLVEKDMPDKDASDEYRYDKNGNLRFVQSAKHKNNGSQATLFNANLYSDQTLSIPGDGVLDFTINFSVSGPDDEVDFDLEYEDGSDIHSYYFTAWETATSGVHPVGKGSYKLNQQLIYSDGQYGLMTTAIYKPFKFTYTNYDELSRVTETGEYYGTTSFASMNAEADVTTNTIPMQKYFYGEASAKAGANNTQGRLSKVEYRDVHTTSNNWGTTWYSYNTQGLIEWIIQDLPGSAMGEKKIEYVYDELGRNIQIGYNTTDSANDHYFWYSYDKLGRLAKVESRDTPTGSWTEDAEYTYFADGQLSDLQLGNGAQNLDYQYGSEGWLDKINDLGALGSDRFAQSMSYQDNGNISSVTWNQVMNFGNKTYTFSYDRANRLTNANQSSGNAWDATYNYDKNGNITTKYNYNDAGSINYKGGYFYITHDYNNSNRILTLEDYQLNVRDFDYDANGNIIKSEHNGLQKAWYDSRNLPNYLRANGSTIYYTYDAAEQRVAKKSGVDTYQYIRGADGRIVATYKNGALQSWNLLSDSDIIGMVSSTYTKEYFLKDHLGSTRTVVSNGGSATEYYDYYPFGKLMPGRYTTTGDVPYNFTGHERDTEAGMNLTYAGARYLDSEIGRWLSIDPYAAKFPNVSPYVYALNNPLAFIDPDGRIPITFHIRSFAPFNYFGIGFHGDGANRGFSRSQDVTSRVKQSFTLETSTGGLSDISTTSDPSGHLVFYGNPTADPSGSVDVTRTNFTDDFNSIGVGAEYAGANPFLPGSPDIDVFSSLSIIEDTKNGTLTISGALTGDNFPSTEAFVQDASGASLFLGVGFYEGSPFSSLGGKNRRNISEFNLMIHTNKDGNFTGVTFNDKRYTLEEWNSFFENANPHGN